MTRLQVNAITFLHARAHTHTHKMKC